MDGPDLAPTADQVALAADARLDTPLERVSFAAGIMLGADALTAEQTYHLRRLTRHQRWLVGPGTVFGLAVDVSETPLAAGGTNVLLTVSPGYAIDGLGREVVLAQAYAVSLSDWLVAQEGDPMTEQAYDESTSLLYLRVTARARPTPTALQPAVAELFDAGLDPVVAARIGDEVLLELSADAARLGDTPARPLDTWAPDHVTPAAAAVPGPVSTREQATLAAQPGLGLEAWLLRRQLPTFDDSPGSAAGQQEAARVLLASLHVTLLASAEPLAGNPAAADVAVNNLVRPFVRPNALLAALALP